MFPPISVFGPFVYDVVLMANVSCVPVLKSTTARPSESNEFVDTSMCTRAALIRQTFGRRPRKVDAVRVRWRSESYEASSQASSEFDYRLTLSNTAVASTPV